MDDVLSLGAAEIARQIRAGQRSVSDVLEAHIRRIEAVNPALNALVTPNFEAARAAAQAADDHVARHGTADLPPLFGVPVSIKDAFPVAGQRFTAGAWALRDQIADEDAEAVARLKAAGAIVLGKTNCPELSWLIETVNPVFGRTHNPHDPARTVGGSSGGEAALIAAGGSPLGLGSDIAGSVRIPAAACGVVSLKPSAGRIPTAGHVPDFGPALPGWNTAGPLARRVEDLALALSVLSETPVIDHTTIDLSGTARIEHPVPRHADRARWKPDRGGRRGGGRGPGRRRDGPRAGDGPAGDRHHAHLRQPAGPRDLPGRAPGAGWRHALSPAG